HELERVVVMPALEHLRQETLDASATSRVRGLEEEEQRAGPIDLWSSGGIRSDPSERLSHRGRAFPLARGAVNDALATPSACTKSASPAGGAAGRLFGVVAPAARSLPLEPRVPRRGGRGGRA